MMIHRIVVVPLLLLAFCSSDAFACSCQSSGEFVEYARQSKAVIRARVVGYGAPLSHGETFYESMSVDIVSVVKGSIGFESIVLLGDPGHLCRDYVDSSHLKIGREYLIALHGDDQIQPFGGCGEAWLRIDGDVAKGRAWLDTRFREYALPLHDLLKTLGQD